MSSILVLLLCTLQHIIHAKGLTLIMLIVLFSSPMYFRFQVISQWWWCLYKSPWFYLVLLKICDRKNHRTFFYEMPKSINFSLNPKEYSFQVTLSQQWNDKRLRFKELLIKKGVAVGRLTVIRQTFIWPIS